MTRNLPIAIAALTLLVTPPALADNRYAKHARHARPDSSFSGSCQFAAVVVFEPRLSTSPQSVTDAARGTGTCSGTFIAPHRDQQLTNAPVSYIASDKGPDATCAAASQIGTGALLFPGGEIKFGLSETRAVSAALLTLTGRNTGSAAGVAAISQSENPLTLAQECSGSGIPQVDVTITLHTTPAMSG